MPFQTFVGATLGGSPRSNLLLLLLLGELFKLSHTLSLLLDVDFFLKLEEGEVERARVDLRCCFLFPGADVEASGVLLSGGFFIAQGHQHRSVPGDEMRRSDSSFRLDFSCCRCPPVVLVLWIVVCATVRLPHAAVRGGRYFLLFPFSDSSRLIF